jgi:LacI family transcriptional regulator
MKTFTTMEPARERATIREVARRAGVSIATVSRALNDHPNVREAVRDRVAEAARVLGYSPDGVARSLRTRQTAVVAFLIQDISNPLLASVARAADEALARAGYLMVVGNSAGRPRGDLDLLDLLWERRVDGILGAVDDEDDPATRAALASSPVPVVLVDRNIEGAPVDAVTADHYAGTRAATLDLARLGHRRIGLVTGPVTQWTGRERLRGYRDGLREPGLREDESLVRIVNPDVKTAQSAATDLLHSARRPTAMIGGGNRVSAGLLRAVVEMGMRIPDQLSVVVSGGFDLLEITSPPLAHVTWSLEAMGEAAAVRLLARMRDQEVDEPRQIILPTEYVARASVGPPPNGSSA